MNPVFVIILFVIILGVLLYYLQSRQYREQKLIPKSTSSATTEKKGVKASDYQAQYVREQQIEQPENDSETESPNKKQEDDMATLEGVGPKYLELLHAAGYTSIKSIAESDPNDLYHKLIEVNNGTHITKRPPTLENIEEWIKSASSKQA